MRLTTIKNRIAYTKPEKDELRMVAECYHLKTDYKNGEKWSKMPYDAKALRNILHTWGEQ